MRNANGDNAGGVTGPIKIEQMEERGALVRVPFGSLIVVRGQRALPIAHEVSKDGFKQVRLDRWPELVSRES